MKKLIMVMALTMGLVACGSEDSPKDDNTKPKQSVNSGNPFKPSEPVDLNYKTTKDFNEIIFGHAFGHCKGEQCIETFRLTSKALFEDSEDDYDHKKLDFTQKLSTEKHNKVKELLNQISADLWNTKEGRVGCPDCADGGGIYVQLSKDGVTKSWFIDNNLASIPKNLHGFVTNVKSKIEQINKKSQ